MTKVYVVLNGYGGDGDEVQLHRIFSSLDNAERWIKNNDTRTRKDGSTYSYGYYIDPYDLDDFSDHN